MNCQATDHSPVPFSFTRIRPPEIHRTSPEAVRYGQRGPGKARLTDNHLVAESRGRGDLETVGAPGRDAVPLEGQGSAASTALSVGSESDGGKGRRDHGGEQVASSLVCMT